VLTFFPEQVRTDVILRIATLEGVQPAALQELNEIMEKQFAGNTNVKSSSVGGVKTAANILNLLDSSMEQAIMERIKEVDAELAESIEDLMFVFDNLIDVDDRGIPGPPARGADGYPGHRPQGGRRRPQGEDLPQHVQARRRDAA